MKKYCPCPGGHFKRRDFLRVGSLSFLGIGLSQFLRLQDTLGADAKAKGQACILIWLDGGPSQMDTWDPKPLSTFKPISTSIAGIQVSELLPNLSQHMDKIAIIRSMRTEENNHLVATHYAATGHSPNPGMKFPSFASIITNELGPRNHIPAHVIVPGMRQGKAYEDVFRGHFIGAENDPLIVPDPNLHKAEGSTQESDLKEAYEIPDLSLPKSLSLERIQERRAFLDLVDQSYRRAAERAEFADMDTFLQQALNMILSPNVRAAFDLSEESQATKEAYGLDSIGQSMLLARRLVEAGSRFVTASGYEGGQWDTHERNDEQHRDELTPTLDRSLSALLEDLDQRGLLESTVVVVMGEFGRTPDINFDGGRDHWPECWSMVLAGGGIRGGQVVGASDERGAYVAERMVTMGDLYATIYKALGIDWHKEYMHPIGRPVKIANSIGDVTGTPLQELI